MRTRAETPSLPSPQGGGRVMPLLQGRGRLIRWGLPLLATAYNFIVLRHQLVVVPELNDSAVHLAYIRWVRQRLQEGHLPLDGWFPNLQLGIAAARHYQTFPDLLTGIVSWPLGVDRTYHLLLYLLLATWPISVYLGARLLGWGWAASLAALVSPLVTSVTGYGYEHSSYTWQGYGLYPQLWAMWLMPLAWGLSWQAVHAGRHLVLASVVLGLTVCCHFLSGYLAFLLVAVWVVCSLAQFWRRVLRAAFIVAGAMGVASWIVVPVLIDGAYTLNSQYVRGTFWQDSFGAPTVLGWLAGGQLLDSGRWAVLTVSAAIGLGVCLFRLRTDARVRALLAALALSLFLFSGRPTFGAVIALLPANKDLLLHRYLMGVQLAGILLAGVGLAHLGRCLVAAAIEQTSRRWVAPAAAATLVAALIAALAPAWSQVAHADGLFAAQSAFQLAAEQRDGADVKSLVDEARRLGGGRIYAGNSTDWGQAFRVGYVPAYIELLNHDADLVGFSLRLPSLVADAEAQFDSVNPAQYQLFGVRYILMPAEGAPPVPATLVATRRAASLWMIDSSGYLAVIDTVPPSVAADRDDLGRKGGAYLRSSDLREGRYHAVGYNGGSAPASSSSGAPDSMRGPAGIIGFEADSLADGSVLGDATAYRPAVVLLKTAFDPNWRITIDGVRAPSMMVMPGLLGVQVPAGPHRLAFRYQPFGGYPPLAALAVVALVCVWRLGRLLGKHA